jgi:hypothetical protein
VSSGGPLEGPEDLAHGAATEERDDLVVAERFAGNWESGIPSAYRIASLAASWAVTQREIDPCGAERVTPFVYALDRVQPLPYAVCSRARRIR